MALTSFSGPVKSDAGFQSPVGMAGASTVAVTAGGSTTPGLTLGTGTLGIYFGSGLPTISAAQGSLYLRTDGSSASTRLYVNSNGTTGWVNVTTAS